MQVVHLRGGVTQAAVLDQLGAWCTLFDGCQRIEEIRPRQPATVLGVIQRLRLVPGESVEAVVTDGTGRLRAIFNGELIAGLELGRGLRLQGTVCMEGGMAVMRNPSWRIVQDPYACGETLLAEQT